MFEYNVDLHLEYNLRQAIIMLKQPDFRSKKEPETA